MLQCNVAQCAEEGKGCVENVPRQLRQICLRSMTLHGQWMCDMAPCAVEQINEKQDSGNPSGQTDRTNGGAN